LQKGVFVLGGKFEKTKEMRGEVAPLKSAQSWSRENPPGLINAAQWVGGDKTHELMVKEELESFCCF